MLRFAGTLKKFGAFHAVADPLQGVFMNFRMFAVSFWFLLVQSCVHPVLALVMPSGMPPGALLLPTASAPQAWKITKPEWSSQDEKSFQEFVRRLGEAVESRQCRTVAQCMKSAANTHHKSDPPGLKYLADCADYPYYLRAYFAWKSGLPFSFATEMKYRDVPGNSGDIRYSRYGNQVAEKFTTASPTPQKLKNAVTILNDLIRNNTSSANFRFHYADDKEELFTDFYPIQISREALQIGTVIYDPNGHVAIVYKIADDGKIYFMDAHPDNSITTGTFGKKFIRSHPGQGAGFKNFRPQKLIQAKLEPQGFYTGGKIVATRNAELPFYGIEQFFGNSGGAPGAVNDSTWSKSSFQIDGKPLTYYEYVRQKMSVGALVIHPVDEMRSLIADLCQSLKDRAAAVDVAIGAGISSQPHPERLPENIYGTYGDWETYSTPSRDAQLKVAFNDLVEQSKDFISKWRNQDSGLVYAGADLAQELLDVYETEARACEISYLNSQKRPVPLTLEQIRLRLFHLSFDPYHCAELRWGAQSPEELGSCADNANKRLWYEREQRLRNQEVRQYEVRMDFSLEDLSKPLPGNGKDTPPDVDLPGYLRSEIQSP